MQTRDARVTPDSIKRMRDAGKRTAVCAGEYVDTFPDQTAGKSGVAPDARLGHLVHRFAGLGVMPYIVGRGGNDHSRGVDLCGCFAELEMRDRCFTLLRIWRVSDRSARQLLHEEVERA